MKYVVLIGDGMADEPQEGLGGMTPLQAAVTPHMDYLATHGCLGLLRTVPDGFPPGSDVANLSILGYSPRDYYTGRAPLEAASLGLELGEGDIAFRCNLVRLERRSGATIMADYSGGGIRTAEAGKILDAIGRGLGEEGVEFHTGVSYRHVVLWRNGRDLFRGLETTPPHDISGRDIERYLPRGRGSELVRRVMERAHQIITGLDGKGATVAGDRVEANGIWLWGQGHRAAMPTIQERYGLTGATVCAVDLVRGIGNLAGLRPVRVSGATGDIDTDYAGKAAAALEALERFDLVVVHVEAPDEASHRGRCGEKIRAIEQFDALVVGAIRLGMGRFGSWRALVLPDHPTPVRTKTHSADPVPFALYDSAAAASATPCRNEPRRFDEKTAQETGVYVEEGWRILDYLVGSGVVPKASRHSLS
jgi:2,3-bisphosphoglycerate-independent phosphoglycerate mutase